jgi:uncharacterized protein (TIGR02246 family)
MRNRVAGWSLLVVFLVASASPAAAQRKAAPGPAAAHAAIKQVNAQWVAAVARADAAAVASAFTEDGMVMVPGSPTVVGRSAIEKAYVPALAVIRDFSLTTKELEVLDSTAIERGVYAMTIALPGRAPAAEVGKYVVVWKRGGDGAWRKHRHIFSSDLPTPAAPVRAAAGDTVFVVLNHVKPEMRAEFERQVDEVWLGAWRKLAETEAVYRSAVPAVRMLAPMGPEADGSYTYVTLIDPLRPGADFTARGTLGRLYPPDKVEELVRAWMANMTRPQEGFRLVQK